MRLKKTTFTGAIAALALLGGISSNASAAVTMDCSLGGNCFVQINPSNPVPTPYSLVWGIGGHATYTMICPLSTSQPHSSCGFSCDGPWPASFSIAVYDANSNLVGNSHYNMAKCVDWQ